MVLFIYSNNYLPYGIYLNYTDIWFDLVSPLTVPVYAVKYSNSLAYFNNLGQEVFI